MSRFVHQLAVVLLALSGLSCSNFISSSSQTKRASYEKHRSDWLESGTPAQYGRARSIQIMVGKHITQEENRFSYDGGLGMATLISRDGYALTAEHVVDDPDWNSFLTTITPGSVAEPTLHAEIYDLAIYRGSEASPRNLIKKKKWPVFRTYLPTGEGAKIRSPRDVVVRQLRVVKTFPEHDLALIKLPFRPAGHFALRSEPVEPGTILFFNGNQVIPNRGASAGEVLKVERAHPSFTTISCATPLAKGDSGGPLFDERGRLVGIASEVVPFQVFSSPRTRHSVARMLDPEVIRQLIAQDRRAR